METAEIERIEDEVAGLWVHDLRSHKVFLSALGTRAATHKDPFDTPYVTLTSGGIKEEGQPYPATFDLEFDALGYFRRELRLFTATADTVFFREVPRLEVAEDGRFVVRCRISVATTGWT